MLIKNTDSICHMSWSYHDLYGKSSIRSLEIIELHDHDGNVLSKYRNYCRIVLSTALQVALCVTVAIGKYALLFPSDSCYTIKHEKSKKSSCFLYPDCLKLA